MVRWPGDLSLFNLLVKVLIFLFVRTSPIFISRDSSGKPPQFSPQVYVKILIS